MLKILNWNTGLIDNEKNYDVVKKYIFEFLKNPNSIAVLQEIPFKNYSNNEWTKSKIYKDLIKTIHNLDYRVFRNETYNNGKLRLLTMIISNINNPTSEDGAHYTDEIPRNRQCTIEIKNKNLSLLGVHLNGGAPNRKQLKSIKSSADIILGDFNAGDYMESENREIFNQILPNHVGICNLPTKKVYSTGKVIRESCIDHIFVKRELVTKCFDLYIHRDISYSDHYPITFKIK